MLKRLIAMVLLTGAGLGLAGYIADYAFLQVRIHGGGNALGSMTIRRYYAVPQKNGRIEFLYADPIDQACVHSLFPHLGDPPCWYLARHPEQRVDM
jgi:hypothetical protein